MGLFIKKHALAMVSFLLVVLFCVLATSIYINCEYRVNNVQYSLMPNVDSFRYMLVACITLVILCSLYGSLMINEKKYERKQIVVSLVLGVFCSFSYVGLNYSNIKSDLVARFYEYNLEEIASQNQGKNENNPYYMEFKEFARNNSIEGVPYYQKHHDDILSASSNEIYNLNLSYNSILSKSFKEKLDIIYADNFVSVREFKDFKSYVIENPKEINTALAFLTR